MDLAGFELVTLKSGTKSLRSKERGETFHSVTGPWLEANRLHVAQQRLAERCLMRQGRPFVVWDVGFGAAANALAAIAALRAVPGARVDLHSFDITRASADFALANAAELDYLAGYERALEELLATGEARVEGIHWRLHLGDFTIQVRDCDSRAPHAILYDPYSAATNPEMWTLGHFEALFARLDPEEPCLWTNYTRASPVRAALLLAGFHVGTGTTVGGADAGGDKETTIASNRLELLEAPLGARWLERVRKSNGAAPLRQARYTQSPMSDEDFARIAALPQFNS